LVGALHPALVPAVRAGGQSRHRHAGARVARDRGIATNRATQGLRGEKAMSLKDDLKEAVDDLPDRVRRAGDTTANYIADKTGSRTLDRWAATGRLQRILLVVAVLLALAGLSLLAGCAAPAKRMEM